MEYEGGAPTDDAEVLRDRCDRGEAGGRRDGGCGHEGPRLEGSASLAPKEGRDMGGASAEEGFGRAVRGTGEILGMKPYAHQQRLLDMNPARGLLAWETVFTLYDTMLVI